jgi:single-strand DNA-binding protein
MLNQIVLVGRLVNIESDEKTIITLAVPRSFKNSEGEYETDYIPVTLWGTIAKNTEEYCKKGDLVGVKGRVVGENGTIELVAEKVTFLSSKKEEDENE